jgi:hypothetical protein
LIPQWVGSEPVRAERRQVDRRQAVLLDRGGETLVKVVTAAQAARASTGKKILSNLLKHDFPKNISSIVEAKRLGKHDDNSIRIHIAQGGCGYEVLRFFSLVPLHGRL